MNMNTPLCLSIVEMGGYPNFDTLLTTAGFQSQRVFNMRKAQSWLKKNKPSLVLAEFHFDPDLRDRMSTLESLLASLQCYAPEAKVITFIEYDFRDRLSAVKTRYPNIFDAVDYPIDENKLNKVLEKLKQEVK